jgi:hypothetical protein
VTSCAPYDLVENDVDVFPRLFAACELIESLLKLA